MNSIAFRSSPSLTSASIQPNKGDVSFKGELEQAVQQLQVEESQDSEGKNPFEVLGNPPMPHPLNLPPMPHPSSPPMPHPVKLAASTPGIEPISPPHPMPVPTPSEISVAMSAPNVDMSTSAPSTGSVDTGSSAGSECSGGVASSDSK